MSELKISSGRRRFIPYTPSIGRTFTNAFLVVSHTVQYEQEEGVYGVSISTSTLLTDEKGIYLKPIGAISVDADHLCPPPDISVLTSGDPYAEPVYVRSEPIPLAPVKLILDWASKCWVLAPGEKLREA